MCGESATQLSANLLANNSVAEMESAETRHTGTEVFVTVRNMAGAILWGPQATPSTTRVASLRSDIAESLKPKRPSAALVLLHGGRPLSDEETLAAANLPNSADLSCVLRRGHSAPEGTVVTGTSEACAYSAFEDLDMPSDLMEAVHQLGLEVPTAMQQCAIAPIYRGCDVLGIAPPCTGKTSSFLIGLLSRLDRSQSVCRVLILTATREKANQIHRTIQTLGGGGVTCHALVGGTTNRTSIQKLKDGQHVVVGQCTRIESMISRGVLAVDKVESFVIDDADDLLSRGFEAAISEVAGTLPSTVQVCCFAEQLPTELDLGHLTARIRPPAAAASEDGTRTDIPVLVKVVVSNGSAPLLEQTQD